MISGRKEKKQKGKRHWGRQLMAVVILLTFLIGLLFIFFPAASNYWNTLNQSNVITEYTENAGGLHPDDYEKILSAAHDYNEKLFLDGRNASLHEEYQAQLAISEQGIMGYIEIPKIDCHLPIYHGTEESALQVAVVHSEGSSLPVGGENTHCVLFGHRGLPSAKLFTDLDQLGKGDLFTLYVLDEVMVYEVEQILVTLPEEVEYLTIKEGEDLCTLVTCTPYGVNSHRLLVTGRRVENRTEQKTTNIPADDTRISILPAAAISAAALLVISLISRWIWIHLKRK